MRRATQSIQSDLRRIVQDAMREMDKDLTALLDELHLQIALIAQSASPMQRQQDREIKPKPEDASKLEATPQKEVRKQAKSTKSKSNSKSSRKSKTRSTGR